jgi:hypothetical protein
VNWIFVHEKKVAGNIRKEFKEYKERSYERGGNASLEGSRFGSCAKTSARCLFHVYGEACAQQAAPLQTYL